MKALIFFDSECPFCYQAVKKIVSLDRQHCFYFAPLKGETANLLFVGPNAAFRNMNSLVLVEHPHSTERQFWVYGQAVSRICWLLGGARKIIGILSFFPAWVTDPIYKIAAIHRHQYKLRIPTTPIPKEHLLP